MATRMKQDSRRPTNVSLRADAVTEAKAYRINVSAACEQGLLAAIQVERERRWLEENDGAITATNIWVEKNGIPFADRRAFRGSV